MEGLSDREDEEGLRQERKKRRSRITKEQGYARPARAPDKKHVDRQDRDPCKLVAKIQLYVPNPKSYTLHDPLAVWYPNSAWLLVGRFVSFLFLLYYLCLATDEDEDNVLGVPAISFCVLA